MKHKGIFFGFIVFLLLTGCTKYDEGPVMSLYSKGKRVAGNWYYDRVLINGEDSTEHYRMQRLDFIYFKEHEGGVFVWYKDISASTPTSDNMKGGKWAFISDKDSLQMDYIDLLSADTITSRWKINRLAYTEFWLHKTVKNDVTIEWRLWKMAF